MNRKPRLLALCVLIIQWISPIFGTDVHSCGACLMIVDEMENEISLVDPKKTIEVGSYRVDPQGNQKLDTVPYARSEQHLHDVIDNICSNSNEYGLAHDSNTGRKIWMRETESDGRARKFEKLEMDMKMQAKLKSNCENVLEDHEEIIIEHLREDEPNLRSELCVDITELCTKDQIVPVPFSFEEETEENEPEQNENKDTNDEL